MSGDNKSMGEILDDIRTLSGSEPPKPGPESQAPKLGRLKGLLLSVPAFLTATVLYSKLAGWLALPSNEFIGLAVLMSFFALWESVQDIRPTTRRHWAILLATVLLSAMLIAATLASGAWSIERFFPGSGSGVLAAVALAMACTATVFLVFWAAARLTRADNLIFPKEEQGGGGGKTG